MGISDWSADVCSSDLVRARSTEKVSPSITTDATTVWTSSKDPRSGKVTVVCQWPPGPATARPTTEPPSLSVTVDPARARPDTGTTRDSLWSAKIGKAHV